MIDDPALLRSVRELGGRLREGLESLTVVEEVPGRGLMLGARFDDGLQAAEVAGRMLAEGLVVNAPAPDTLRMLPPLIIGEAEVDKHSRSSPGTTARMRRPPSARPPSPDWGTEVTPTQQFDFVLGDERCKLRFAERSRFG